ncbi:hypothetical protein V6N13_061810 [Hibiscus sabdariffa]
MHNNSPTWNEEKVSQVFNEEDAQQILRCPIAPSSQEHMIWEGFSNGIYITKSAYNWLSKRDSGPRPIEKIWKILKKLRTMPKIKALHGKFAKKGS